MQAVVTCRDVLEAIRKHSQKHYNIIVSRRVDKEASRLRRCAMCAALSFGHSFVDVGMRFGRDHSTVCNSRDRYTEIWLKGGEEAIAQEAVFYAMRRAAVAEMERRRSVYKPLPKSLLNALNTGPEVIA